MRTLKALLIMLTINATVVRELSAAAAPSSRPRPSEAVKVCQVGYLPGETKFAMITDEPTGDVILRRAPDGAAVLTVKAAAVVKDADSGDMLRAVDFSKLSEPGSYYLDVPGVGASHEFRVGDDVFARPFRLAMRSYTGQRCGVAVNLALRQSFLSNGSGDMAYGIFCGFFVICLIVTWAVYLRPSPERLVGI